MRVLLASRAGRGRAQPGRIPERPSTRSGRLRWAAPPAARHDPGGHADALLDCCRRAIARAA